MTTLRPLRTLLVDPSLFTPPYDAALNQGLRAAGVETTWAVRKVRPGDREELSGSGVDAFFYRRSDGLATWPPRLRSLAKGLEHIAGLGQLVSRVVSRRPDVVHFQWAVLPVLDAAAMALIRLRSPVVFTVHDTVPYNGERISWLQNFAVDVPARVADAVIVHTRAARETLVRRGIAEEKIRVVPHGPLELPTRPSANAARADARYTFVLFGELKHYKGVDLLVEAAGRLSAEARAAARFVVAGRPRMDLGPVYERIRALGLEGTVEIREGRLSEQEMTDLFTAADAFVLPYRQIDASSVFYLLRPFGKWMVASRVGVFADELGDEHGELVPPGEAPALAAALERAVLARKAPAAPPSASSSWAEIGRATVAAYASARARRLRGALAPEEVAG